MARGRAPERREGRSGAPFSRTKRCVHKTRHRCRYTMTTTTKGRQGAPGAVAGCTFTALAPPPHPLRLPAFWPAIPRTCLVPLAPHPLAEPGPLGTVAGSSDLICPCRPGLVLLNIHLHPLLHRPNHPGPSAPAQRPCRTKGSIGHVSWPSPARHTIHTFSSSSPPARHQASSTRGVVELASRYLWGLGLLPSRSSRPRRDRLGQCPVHNNSHAHRPGRGTRHRGRLGRWPAGAG